MADPNTPLQTAIKEFIPLGRSGLLPALHAAQKIFGWIDEITATEISKSLRVPLADVHGVIEFYSLFYNEPIGRRVIRVCTDQACALKNADGILGHLCAQHNLAPRQTTADGALTIEPSPCLGLCELAPAALVDDQAETLIDLEANTFELGRPRSIVDGTIRMLTAHCGNGTTTLAHYGKYSALTKSLSMTPAAVVAEIKDAGLVGRGGAAFPTAIKWEGAAAAQADQKYVICNADESEPGTFKDRILLIDDPHRTVEGMLIAAYAVGASKGYIYIRGEYPYIVPVLENALSEARDAGMLGENILGSNFSFDIEIRVGAGAYICGEETALFESIEGKRGFPRVKPPFPTTHGVFGKPTVINNVETLCNVPLIIAKGAADYRTLGTEKSPGPKLFCLSGDVTKPGLYEVPFGVTLRELLALAGGIADGKKMKAVLFGGAAGAFATSAHLDVKMTFEDLRAAGLPLGSGVVMVFDETRDLRDALKRLGHFFAHESCGKCYPCQMGTQRQMEILDRVAMGNPLRGDLIRLQDVGWTMTDASLCGLGQTAAGAVLSAIKLWPDLFEEGSKIQPVRTDQKEVQMSQPFQPEKKDDDEVDAPKSQEPVVQHPQASWMPMQKQEDVGIPAKPMQEMLPTMAAAAKPVKKTAAKKAPAKKAAAKKPAKRALKKVVKKKAAPKKKAAAKKPARAAKKSAKSKSAKSKKPAARKTAKKK